MSGELFFALELGVSGLLVGVMYSLVALGFVLIYKASAVFNFAQGAMTLFAALALVGFIPYVGLVGGLAAVMALMALLALGIERIILRPLVARPPLSLFMATIGLGFFLEGFSQALWGTQPKGLDIGIPDTPFEVAGVFIEPIVGSGGVLIPPDPFWPALIELCRDHGWLLGVDEVKSGFGRTGTMWAVDRWGIEPDLMCLGKAMGGGVLPIGAVLGSERAMGTFDDVPTGSTWAWLPAACVAALETIRAFEEGGVLDNVGVLDEEGKRSLGRLHDRFEAIGDIR
jgi:hypothetical protein